MMNLTPRRYPIGIQTFSEIIKGKYVYVDKTDLVWKLAQSKYIFLSRPRRFGKSLLSTTLMSYFLGEKALFEGLKIMQYEHEWEHYPVLHLDLSVAKAETSVEGLQNVLFRLLDGYKATYGEGAYETTPGGLFSGIIQRAYEKTGKQVVVIIDEYDAPLLDKLHAPELLGEFRNAMQEFFVQLKADEAMIRFCFITGITKFSQLSIFSTLNNLRNVSMETEFSAICGITMDEFLSTFDKEIGEFAEEYGVNKERMTQMMKLQYDGYHFTKKSPDLFNPFSLINACASKDLGSFWFSSGTPTFLFEQMKRFGTNILELEKIQLPASQFDIPTEGMASALPLLYQSGYLTIKSYDRYSDTYILDFPNAEVKVGFMENFMSHILEVRYKDGGDARSFAGLFYAALVHHDIDKAMQLMQAFFAAIPYPEHGNKELDDLAHFEAYYEVLMYVVFSVINCRTYTQVKSARGRCDLVVFMNDATYVMELKVNGTPEEALAQIEDKGYTIPYQNTDKPVVKIGIAFSQETRTVSGWKVVA